MALDTREKRAAVGQDWFLQILPLPDGTLDAADRAQLSLMSSALTYAEETPDEGGSGAGIIPNLRRRRLKMRGLFR